MNIGISVCIIALSVIGFIMFDNVTTARKEKYLKRTDLTEEARHAEAKESWQDRMAAIARIAIYATSAVAAFSGDLLGIILTCFFTVEGYGYILIQSAKANKSMAVAMTYLALPFGAVIGCAVALFASSVALGFIVGLASLVLVRFASKVVKPIIDFVDRGFTAKEKDKDDTEEDKPKAQPVTAKVRTRKQNVEGA